MACSAWFYAGGGEALYRELVNDILKLNVTGLLYFPMPAQPLGWFRKEIKGAETLKGVNYRIDGLAADLFRALGATVTVLPSGEIVSVMDRGLLDAAALNNPSSDLQLGLPGVAKTYVMASHHRAAGGPGDHVQQGQVRRPACRDQVDPAPRGAGRLHQPARHGLLPAIPRTSTKSASAASRWSAPAKRCLPRSSRPGTR